MRCKKCDGTGGDHMSDEGGKGYCSACRGTGEVQEHSDKKPIVEAVARKFCQLLLKEIGPKDVSESVRRNRAEKSPGVCHTHDFCDANMVMDAAMRAYRLDVEDDNTDVWNEAWDLAKKAEFDPVKIPIKSPYWKNPVAGDIITLKGESGTFLVVEWNGDRGFVSPTKWPYTIIPQELVSATDIKSIVRSKGKNPPGKRHRARNIELTGPDIAEGPYVLTLEAWGNPDYRQDSDRLFAPRQKVEVHALNEGAGFVREYIGQHQLGGGNWVGAAGQLFTAEGKAYVGRYSYNGRFWSWNNTDGHGLPSDMSIPDGLSKLGLRAFWIIVAVLARTGAVHCGGSRAFRNPDDWARGHQYCQNSELIIVHDGGDPGNVFGQFGDPYAEIQERLKKEKLYIEGCTSTYSAVYKIEPVKITG